MLNQRRPPPSTASANDQGAWYDLWETFGPVLRAQFTKWGRGRIGPETCATSAETSPPDSIDHQPERGRPFSTWLLAIAYTCWAMNSTRRNAQKPRRRAWRSDRRVAGRSWMVERRAGRSGAENGVLCESRGSDPFGREEKRLHRLRSTACVLDGKPGGGVAEALGIPSRR